MQHFLHQHPLQRKDPRSLYPDYNGFWKCDNCEENREPVSQPFHCNPCAYDLCEICFSGQKYGKHPHIMYLTKMQSIYPDGRWKCDNCGLLNTDLPQHAKSSSYHCPHSGCEYDVCQICFQENHAHVFIRIPIASSTRDLVCGICSGGQMQKKSEFVLHCKECRYNVCAVCHSNNFISIHPHPLHKTDCSSLYANSKGRWSCDVCQRIGSPNTPGLTSSFHCKICDFDICLDCMEKDRDGKTSHLPGMDIPGPQKRAFINGLTTDGPYHLSRVVYNFKPCDEDQSV